MEKKGQLTIFIIIAVVVVALGVMVYFFVPQIRTGLGVSTNNPILYMQNCVKEKVETTVNQLSIQGGSSNPQKYLLHNDQKIEYLCYTEEYYTTCVMQQPLLKQHIESEIKTEISSEVNSCLDSMKQSFERQGYEVNLVKGNTDVELVPNKIQIILQNSLTLTREGSERYDNITVEIDKSTYELVSIANSILNMEARYGDSETTIYMDYYRDIKVEKNKQTDGSKIYILTDRNTGDKFQFATRSVAWPPGI